MPKKSVFRQPGAQNFQLVHRSQRDPLIHDPDASQHVLKFVERPNAKKGKSGVDTRKTPPSSGLESDCDVGEAALYGIYYDDTEYDYMQHLRQVGVQEEGVESVLIEAPSTSRRKSSEKTLLPSEALPSAFELPRNYESLEAVPSSIAGFKPDMDPHLRQVLQALDDEAFMDDSIEEDFFGQLVADGKRVDAEAVEFEFQEDGEMEEGSDDETEEGNWEARFAKFKKDQKTSPPTSDLGDDDSEGRDTINGLPKLPVIGGKRRRKGASDASGYTMSSSSMFRTEALQTLDERFDKIMDKEYASDDGEGNGGDVTEDSDEAPELISSREDFTSMMDDFLANYEIIGRKMRPKLEGDSGPEKLDTLRRAMGQDERVRLEDDRDSNGEEKILMPFEVEAKGDRWDCETILTTYSNLENHPRLIRARDGKLVPKIGLDPRTGLPSVIDPSRRQGQLAVTATVTAIAEEEDLPIRETITRPRNESKEDKRARKQAVKADRQARRIHKKTTKEQFSSEVTQQMKGIVNKERTRMRKL